MSTAPGTRSGQGRLPQAADPVREKLIWSKGGGGWEGLDCQSSVEEVATLMAVWSAEESRSAWDAKPTLRRLSELLERELEAYLKADPDPFDDRHPQRVHPASGLGALLKTLSRNEIFMSKVHPILIQWSLDDDILICLPASQLVPAEEGVGGFVDVGDAPQHPRRPPPPQHRPRPRALHRPPPPPSSPTGRDWEG